MLKERQQKITINRSSGVAWLYPSVVDSILIVLHLSPDGPVMTF